MSVIEGIESFLKGAVYGLLAGIFFSAFFLYCDYLQVVHFVEVLNNG